MLGVQCPWRPPINRSLASAPKPGYRLLLVALLCGVSMFADRRTDYLAEPRHALSYLMTPIHYVANFPSATYEWGKTQTQSRAELLAENAAMKRQLLVLQQRVQKIATLEAENVRLHQLLNSAANLDTNILAAQIIGIDPDVSRQEVVINKGTRDQVYRGQAVLDAGGLLGQVVNVGVATSRVLLITDASHALSVQVNRSGVRAILSGTGKADQLRLLYVPGTADIKEGDLLVSTGLDKRYPSGYPVARVASLRRDSGSPFVTVFATPEAHIEKVTHVLLVSPESKEEFEPWPNP